MLEITNKKRFPVQLIVRSRRASRSFTTLNLPGVGSGKNVYHLEDERSTEYIDRAANDGLIAIRKITNMTRKGE
jgi:hypothetical protein